MGDDKKYDGETEGHLFPGGREDENGMALFAKDEEAITEEDVGSNPYNPAEVLEYRPMRSRLADIMEDAGHIGALHLDHLKQIAAERALESKEASTYHKVIQSLVMLSKEEREALREDIAGGESTEELLEFAEKAKKLLKNG